MSDNTPMFVAVILVFVLLAVIFGICVATAAQAQTRATRVLFTMLACLTMIACAITVMLMRRETPYAATSNSKANAAAVADN